MSDKVDRKLQELDELAEKAGFTIKPETRRFLEQKLNAEEQLLAKLQAEKEASGIDPLEARKSSDWYRRVESLMDQPPPAAETVAAALASDAAQPKPSLRRIQPTGDQPPPHAEQVASALLSDAAKPPEPQHPRPIILNERGLGEFIETSPEKPEKRIYGAEKRLRNMEGE